MTIITTLLYHILICFKTVNYSLAYCAQIM